MSLSHDPVKEVRDPVYGFVKLSEAEWDIVNCPEVQRLRDIRQLAMGHLVYPGANQTRLEHSIGCLFLSTLMFDGLSERNGDIIESEFGLPPGDAQPRARQLLRLAALLHDLGHAPFSHSGEALLPIRSDPKTGQPMLDPKGKPQRLSHEEMTSRIIREGVVGDRITKHFGPRGIGKEEVIAIATDLKFAKSDEYPYHSFLHDLLAGELGSDRIDYLLRDAHHSGQKAGDFDYRRLVGTLRMVPPPEEGEPGHRIGFDHGGWLVAEQMIVARYLMYQSLYFHKTKRILQIHLEDFMREWLRSQRGVAELPAGVADYLKISDSVVIAALGRAADAASHPGHQHAARFRDRSHKRLAKELILADNYWLLEGRRKPLKKRFDKLKNDVRLKFGSSVVCDEPDRTATAIFEDTTKIWVLLDNETRYLDDISEIVRGMSDKIWRGRVYAEKGEKNIVKDWCDSWLLENPMSAFRDEGGEHAGEQTDTRGLGSDCR